MILIFELNYLSLLFVNILDVVAELVVLELAEEEDVVEEEDVAVGDVVDNSSLEESTAVCPFDGWPILISK